MIARDRGGACGPVASRACPGARQVADRWHLFENASAALLDAVRRTMPRIRAALGVTPADPRRLTSVECRQHDGFLRRSADEVAIRDLAEAGASIKEIVRRTGRSRKVVRAVVRGSGTDVSRARTSMLDAFLPRLEAEWTAGCRNGAELWRRLRDAGFPGALRVVTEWATRRRRAASTPGALSRKPPSARAIARLMTCPREHLSSVERKLVATVQSMVPALYAAVALVGRFQDMLRSKKSALLRGWLDEARNGLLAGFAQGIAADYRAVEAAITEQWSNGQTEGQITKLKLLKRQMHGRASLDLLHARLSTA